jgi:hypothetical protein
MKKGLFVTVMAMILSFAGLAEAQCCGDDWHGGDNGQHGGPSWSSDCDPFGCGDPGDDFCGATGCYPVLVLLREMDLTDSQRDEVDAIVEDTQDRVEAAFADAGFENPFDGFLQIFCQPNLSASSLSAFTEKLGQLQETLEGIQYETLVQIHDVLTSEQLAELAGIDTEGSWCGANWGWDDCGTMGHGYTGHGGWR